MMIFTAILTRFSWIKIQSATRRSERFAAGPDLEQRLVIDWRTTVDRRLAESLDIDHGVVAHDRDDSARHIQRLQR